MRIKKSTISDILIVFALLFQCCFFHFFSISGLMSRAMLVCIIATWLLSFIIRKDVNDKFANRYIFSIFVFVFLVQGAYTIITGKQSLKEYFEVLMPMMAILLFSPLLKKMKEEDSVWNVVDIITSITSIYMFVVLINAFMRNTTGSPLIHTDYYLYDSGFRNGRLRIMIITPFLILAPICIFLELIFERGKAKKFFYIIEFIICVGVIFYVEQTRMNQIMLIVCCAVMFSLKINNKGIRTLIYIFSAVLMLMGMVFGYSNEFINSFSVSNKDYGVSTAYRIYEYQHAFKNIIANPIFGEGFVGNYLQKVSYGGYNFNYNHTDIGLIGTISYLGISSIPLIIWPLCRYVFIYLKIPKQNRNGQTYMLYTGVLLYVILSQFTLSITDSVRIFAFPFVLAILEFCSQKLIEVKNT